VFVRPRNLSILTTRRCTAACDHCSMGASPGQTENIPVERIHRLIDEAARVPSLERIGFSGGECFLLGRALDELVGHAAERGFATRVVTNGYWAVTSGAARARTDALRGRGLDEMMLSTGTFHQRFVPVERVIAAARAAADAGITTRVSVETCDQSSFDAAALDDALADLIAARTVHVSRDPWIPDAGRRGEGELSHEHYLADTGPHGTGRCTQVLDVISVTPAQQLLACCGLPCEQLPRLRIGSVADRALDEVLCSTPDDLLKLWLHVAGPAGIAAFVASHVPGYALPRTATICQACVALQQDERAMRVVGAYGKDVARAVVDTYLHIEEAREPLGARHVSAS
jgi:hypothetical protein